MLYAHDSFLENCVYSTRLRWYLFYSYIARAGNYTKRAQRTGKGIQGVFQKCFTVIFCCACSVMRSLYSDDVKQRNVHGRTVLYQNYEVERLMANDD